MKKNTTLQLILLVLLTVSSTVMTQNITYSFANATISSNGTDSYYEADIMIATDSDFVLGMGQLYFNYNNDAFNENIIGMNDVTAIPSGISNGDYVLYRTASGSDIYNIVTNDNTNTIFSYAWTQEASASDCITITASGSPHKLFRLKMKMINTSIELNEIVSLNTSLSHGLTFTASTTPTTADATQLTNDTFDSSENTFTIVWTGAVDNDWNTAENWLSNSIPTSTANIFIPNTVTNFPTITDSSVRGVGTVTIESGASFISQSPISGNITYQRTLNSSNWYLISSPVVGQDEDDFVTASNLELGSGNNVGLGTYDTATDSWSYYQNGTSTTNTLLIGEGRSVNSNASSNELEFTGTLYTNNLSQSLNITGNQYNLLGNPYTSYLEVSNLLRLNSIVLATETLWFWDASANAGNGAYITKVTADDFKIAPTQGFFVQSNGSSNIFGINKSWQVHKPASDTFLRGSGSRSEIHVNLTDGTNEMQAKIYYINGTSTSFDNGFDGAIFGGNVENKFNVYTKTVNGSSAEKLAIQSLPNENFEDMIIPVGVITTDKINIEFSINTLNFPTELNVFLEDKNNGTFTKLNESGASYTTTVNASTNVSNRFFIHTTTQSRLSTVNDLALKGISIYTTPNNSLIINGLQNIQKASLQLYNLIGQQVMKTTSFTANNSYEIQLPKLQTGIYLATLTTNSGKKTKKILIK